MKIKLSLLIILLFFSVNIKAQLSGSKIIGSAPSDYTSFSAAVNDLNAVGVNGPLTFQIKPGVYNEKIWINPITGSSSTNTVFFVSQNTDSTSVILTYSPTSYSDNYTVYLYGADNIVFSNITLASGGSTYSNVVVIDSSADNNTFMNCRIEGYATNQASVNQALIYSSGFDENGNVFYNNYFDKGSYGLYYYGTSARESGTVIRNNVFNEQYYSGIYLSNQDAALVMGNTIFSSSPTNFRAIHSQYGDNKTIIAKNKINVPNSAGGYGLYITNSEGILGNEAIIANNFIRINTTGNTCSGINCISSTNQGIYNNSVNVTGNYNSSNAMSFEGYGTTGISIKNNIFANNASGRAIYCYLSTSLFSTDYNAYYSNGTYLCNYYGNLAQLSDWQSATSMDAHSIVSNPPFVSSSDLHIIPPSSLSAAGITIAAITDDIDDEIRKPTPDIGADEFIPLSLNENIDDISFIKMYPNPVQDHICAFFTGKSLSYVISDISGRRILSGELPHDSEEAISVEILKQGIYFLECISGEKRETFKFIKSNF